MRNEGLKVFLGLVIGLGIIIYMNPPHTVCDSKKEAYVTSIMSYQKPFGQKLKQCQDHTDLGGCLAFFEVVGRLLENLDDVGAQCRAKLHDDKSTRKWINTSMELIARAAWGTKAPVSYQQKNGWLDMNQVHTFCKLKKSLIEIYSEDAWLEFVNYILAELPQAPQLGRDQAWARSVISDPCKF